MANKAYVFTGHGNEITTTPFSARQTIPEGVTLVTLTECGIPTNAPDTAKVIQRLNASPELFAKLGTPDDTTEEEVKAQLGKDIHIYRKGMPYPDLRYAPISDLHPPKKGDETYTLYAKSGVYTLPVPLTERPEWKCGNNVLRHKPTRYTLPLDMEFAKYCPMTKGFDTEAAKESFAGSVYPTGDQLEAILKTKKDNFEHPTNEEDTYIPIGEVFAKLGTGVYYWIICRGSDESPGAQAIRSESRGRQGETVKGGRKRRGNRKTYRKKRRVRKAH